MSDYRRIRTGRGQANLGNGNRNIGRDHIDNRRHVHNQGGMYAEGNLHYRDGDYYDVQNGPSDTFDDIVGGRGIGRFIAAIGTLIALAGFGGWMYVIFSGFASDGTSFDPMELEVVDGYPMMVVGFAAVVVGGVIGAIGGSMAKAARRRHERAMYYRRRRGL